MSTAHKYQDLVAWQRSMELASLITEITATGPASRDFRFRDQICEAADAAPPLIAEGFVRFTTAEFVRYLRMARGELAEVQTHLLKAKRRAYFTAQQQADAEALAGRALGTITNLLKSKVRQLADERPPAHRPRPRRTRDPGSGGAP